VWKIYFLVAYYLPMSLSQIHYVTRKAASRYIKQNPSRAICNAANVFESKYYVMNVRFPMKLVSPMKTTMTPSIDLPRREEGQRERK